MTSILKELGSPGSFLYLICMPKIIETYNQLSSLKQGETVYIDYLTKNSRKHPAIDDIISIYLYNFEDSYLINVSHPEALQMEFTQTIQTLLSKYTNFLVRDKIRATHLYPSLPYIDLQTSHYFETNQPLPKVDPISAEYFFYNKYPNVATNKIIPLTIHLKRFDEERKKLDLDNTTYSNDEMCEALHYLSSQPIKVNGLNEHYDYNPTYNQKEDQLYSLYKFTTATSRPVCTFNGVSLSTLKKDNGERTCIVPNNDTLIEMDYDGYHPRIIANLVDYTLEDISVHEQMAKMYFGEVTQDNYKQAKQLTFKQMYGGIFEQYKNIPYFAKTQQFIDKLWDEFNERGEVETFFFKRPIKKENHLTITPQKLFNYYIQAYETEYNLRTVLKIKEYLKDFKTKLVLYTYDAFLFDFAKDDGKQFILELKQIINKDFPTKIQYGSNYGALKAL